MKKAELFITQDQSYESTINFMYFLCNYPVGWLGECFEDEGEVIVNHFNNKWQDLCIRKGTLQAPVLFFFELTDDRKAKLIKWVDENYDRLFLTRIK